MKVLHVVAGLPSKERPFQQPFIKSQIDSLKKQGLDIDIFEIKGYNSKYSYLKAIKEIKTKVAIDHSDVIHAHYSYCGIISYLAKTNRPIVLSLMGSDLFGTRNKIGKVSFRGKLDKIISKFIVNKVNHVIVKSENMRSLIQTNVPVSVIPNGVDFEIFKAEDLTESRKKLGLDIDDFIVLFLGNSNDPIKNFDLAKKGFDIFKESKDDPKIIFKNPYGIDQTSVLEYMNASDVLLLTSFYEGSPNVIKEAMACNLPIISTNVGDVKEVINDTKNCFLVSYSENEIAKKLSVIFNDRSRSNGREKINHLNSKLIAEKVIDVYKSLFL